jgi:hypothetical protein
LTSNRSDDSVEEVVRLRDLGRLISMNLHINNNLALETTTWHWNCRPIPRGDLRPRRQLILAQNSRPSSFPPALAFLILVEVGHYSRCCRAAANIASSVLFKRVAQCLPAT